MPLAGRAPVILDFATSVIAQGKTRVAHNKGEAVEPGQLIALIVTPDDGSEVQEIPVSKRSRLNVEDGDHIQVGHHITSGTPDPQDVLRVLGVRKAQEHLIMANSAEEEHAAELEQGPEAAIGDDPLAVMIQSSSAAGKTSLMDAVLAFAPEEDRVKYSAV